MPDNKPLSAPQKALIKLGLARDIDLALHLPLRYEDETRIVKLRDAREGDVAQIEATVTACEIAYRPRRQLLVTVDDGSDTCVLRFSASILRSKRRWPWAPGCACAASSRAAFSAGRWSIPPSSRREASWPRR
jgi:RecG-like helicase